MKKQTLRFYVNEEKKLVVAVLQIKRSIFEDDIVIRAKAKCSPQDEFDVLKGKKIATHRVKLKLLNAQMRQAKREQLRINTIVSNLEKDIQFRTEKLEELV